MNTSYFKYLSTKWARETGPFLLPTVTADETIETIHNITRKNSAPKQVATDEAPTIDRGDQRC